MLQSRGNEPAVLQACSVDLAFFAKCHHLVGHHASGFGLGEGGGDAAVFDQAAHEVVEHAGAMLGSAAQFGFANTVAHGAGSGN